MINENTSQALCDKWAPILEGIEDAYTRESTAVLLENQARHVLAEQAKSGMLEESTTVGQLGTFQKFAFPLVRRVFPELIANKVVGVQPMQGPVSQVFYLGYDRVARHGHNSTAATTQSVYGKYLLTYRGQTAGALFGDASGGMIDLDASTPGWQWTASAGGEPGTDPNGKRMQNDSLAFSSNLTGTVGEGIASFPSSVLGGWNTSAGEVLGNSGSPAIPEINFHIEQQAVIASTRKFRALWTIEAAQDLKAYHNLDLERELTDLLGKEVALEIDREILEDLRMIAYDVSSNIANGFSRGALDLGNPNNFPEQAGVMSNNSSKVYQPGNFTYDQATGLGVRTQGTNKNVYFVDLTAQSLNLAPRHVGEAYSNLLAAVNFASQDIYRTTYRGAGNFIITSPLVAAMLQSAAKLEGGIDPSEAGTLGANIVYKGRWNGAYDVYVDPLWPEDEILVGYKGSSPMESGFVYAPYIPIQMLPTVVNPDDFQPRKGLITRYGKASITPDARWYRVIRIVGASNNYLFQPFSRINDTLKSASDNDPA